MKVHPLKKDLPPTAYEGTNAKNRVCPFSSEVISTTQRRKMEIKIDTHSHSIASGHAYSSIQEMVEAAKKKNMEVLMITEHAPRMPGTCHLFYFSNLKIIPRNCYGITVLYGVELNILDTSGQIDMPHDLLEEMDIVVASIHKQLFEEDWNTKNFTKAYINAMKNPLIKVIGHPDDSRCLPDYEKLVKAAKETDTLLEINNSSLMPSSFRINTRENILSMLDLCKKYQAKVTTGSDAHIDVDVANFTEIQKVLEYCNFPEELVVTTDPRKIKPYVSTKAQKALILK